MRGFRQVFSFTLKQVILVRSYRLLTVAMALLLFAIPAALLPLSQNSAEDSISSYEETEAYEDQEEEAEPETGEEEALPAPVTPELIAYVAEDGVPLDWMSLLSTGLSGYTKVTWEKYQDLQVAEEACAGQKSLILYVAPEEEEGMDYFNVIVPEDSGCSITDADLLYTAIAEGYNDVLLQNLTEEQKEALQAAGEPEVTSEEMEQEAEEIIEEEDETEDFGSFILFLILPYLNIMLVYFLVLYYGQNTANSLILEKTSKLMDTMLVSVDPRAMVIGKVTATWAASVIQFMIWVLCLGGGIAAGTFVSLQINPAGDSVVIMLLTLLGESLGRLGALKIILALILIFAGFFMYCALSSIGGAIAGKPEELSATNTLFTLVLVVSFMGALYSGFMNQTLGTGLAWVDFLPSVSVLITPARLLIGRVPLYGGLISLLITFAVAFLLMLLSARIYTMMSMYKGALPKPKQLFSMLKKKH